MRILKVSQQAFIFFSPYCTRTLYDPQKWKEDITHHLLLKTLNTKYSGSFFFTPTNFPTLQMGTECPTIKFNSDTNYQQLASFTQVKRQSHKTSPTTEASCKSQVTTCTFDQPSINQGFPQFSPQVL